MENKDVLTCPVLPVSGTLLLPGTPVALQSVSREDLSRIENRIFLALMVKSEDDPQSLDDFYHVGVTCQITSVTGKKILAKTLQRVSLMSLEADGKFFNGQCQPMEEIDDLDLRSSADMLVYIKDIVRQIAQSFRGGKHIADTADSYEDINELITYLAQYMPLTKEERYELLTADSLKERSLRFIDFLLRQKQMVALNLEMNEKLSDQANRAYREQALRKQLEAIQEELGEDDDEDQDLIARLKAAPLPEKVKKEALAEAKKLDTAQGMEADVIRTHLEFMLDLPWKQEPVKPVKLADARAILDADHYGLKKVKERILQHLAVMQLKNAAKGSALLLVGPPGTGKTSLGKSIAKALDREYVRVSLGGVRDEAEIRGHRRTYVGAMAGRILQSMKRAGTTNPVMVLDEIDKLMQGGFSGDPAAAMLEVLDPEQNNSFTDHYLDQPYDLSQVFFIATANSLDTIPGPLLDRMEVIEMQSYTPEEKFHIGKEHLLPAVLEEHGIPADKFILSDEMLQLVIEDWTMEAGCRGLKKQLSTLARAASEDVLEGKSVVVDKEMLERVLGRKWARHEKVQESNPCGVVTGLAWTPVGGEVLFIETSDMPGTGQLIITGQLGDVMKESVRISLSLLKSRLPMNTRDLKERDIHIHVPAGSTPKDGPSAGITLFTALASLILNKPVSSHLAMTGEVTLRGDVLPIGGLKEKLYGAQRAGITKVLIPWQNKEDLQDVDPAVLEALEIVPVKTVEDVLQEAIGMTLPRLEHSYWEANPMQAK